MGDDDFFVNRIEKKVKQEETRSRKEAKKMLTLIRVVIGLQAIALFSQFKGK